MMADFDKIVGLKYLKAVHLNDSVGTLFRFSTLNQDLSYKCSLADESSKVKVELIIYSVIYPVY